MEVVPFVVGAALLFFGYRYYWFVAGGVGFLFGLNIGSAASGGQITPAAVMIGLLVGIIVAFTAVFVANITLSIAGFLLGGIVLVQLFAYLDWNIGSTLVTFLLGGMMGLLITISSKDFAKILFSALVGAAIIVTSLEMDAATVSFVFLVLVIVGITAQLFLQKRWQ